MIYFSTDNEKSFQDLLYKKTKKKYNLDDGRGLTISKVNDGRLFLFVYCKKNDIGIISHEALHCVNFILDHIGHEASHQNDEVQAYLLLYLINKFLQK